MAGVSSDWLQPGSGQQSQGSPKWKEIKMLLLSHESRWPNLPQARLGWRHLAPECGPWCNFCSELIQQLKTICFATKYR